MNVRSICFLSIIIIVSSSFVVVLDDDGSDAEWVDPNYRDPPNADHVINITDELRFTSRDPAYTMSWDVNDGSGTDNASAIRFLALSVAASNEGNSSYSYVEDSCLPSWITWDAFYSDKDHISIETSTFEITIRPALQQVADNTVGNYWIWFECRVPDGFGTAIDTYLIKFTVHVDWDGGVIIPETYSEFILRLDYGIPGGANNKTMRITTGVDVQEVRFVVKDLDVVREGYTFKGWSQTSGSSSTDIGDEFPVNVNMSNVRTTVDDNGCKVHEITIYAVWELVEEDIILPDFLGDLLDLLSDPAVLILVLVTVFGVAFIVRMRRIGGI